ncbi:MAG: FAD-dependent oxidoreductase [Lactobacillaceae bacterium]|jgi:NADPH-dependent 2,4-dienoyl-CoA reductase/sulfur reductase-like enzyme|nr:FAD-dependent oxidoreductase [Lactobacillaceae bacterium]
MIKTQLLIIGGSDAGISAALQARELNKEIKITIVMADSYPNFSICGLPYALSGEVSKWQNLSHRTMDDLKAYDIDFYLDTIVGSIDVENHQITAGNQVFEYEQLIVGTGMKAKTLPIFGDESKVGYLTSMGRFFQVEAALKNPNIRTVAVVGSGYVGIESAEALKKRGYEVVLITKAPEVLSTLDADLSKTLHDKLVEQGIKVITNQKVDAVYADNFDFTLVAVGVNPNSKLLIDAGADFDARGAIVVDDQMHTSLKDIYAAGDLVETKHRLLGQTYLPLGTTAHKQGRIAGANAVGSESHFAGILGTQVIRVFDLIAARTGLRLSEAIAAGFNAIEVTGNADDHKAYIPGSHSIQIRVVADVDTHRILGAQLLGSTGAEIPKRTDIFSTAIYNQMTVEQFSDLDLTYSPVVGSPWDAVQMVVQKLEAAIRNND